MRATRCICWICFIVGVMVFSLLFSSPPISAFADTPKTDPALVPGVNPKFIDDSLLKDKNGDGKIDIIAFGDSITRGVGDFLAPNQQVFEPTHPENEQKEAGYPLRLETLLQIPVSNFGSPGEVFSDAGISRYARVIPSLRPDLVIISSGANDARDAGISPEDFSVSMQTALNIAYASGVTPVLASIPPQCCNHAFLQPQTSAYNAKLERLSTINSVPIARVTHAFRNVCNGNFDCYLLNRPEGLHPNSAGYDIQSEAILATLLQIDLFDQAGPAKLEEALNLPAGSVTTTPDVPAP